MGEDKGADAIAGRGLGGVGHRRVVVEDVDEAGQADLLDQIATHDGVHQHVGSGTQLVESRSTAPCRRR